jgi:hypothetical protein
MSDKAVQQMLRSSCLSSLTFSNYKKKLNSDRFSRSYSNLNPQNFILGLARLAMRPTARGLAQHGGPHGLLEESDVLSVE